ncbi:MAG: nucleoid-associated protein [Saprospiraceae bacterium]|nr:nucleoid-associated protein [Saprospiraceae bacterium]MDW8482870.1 nucleoid-associated protein [Saprospiraceae bacterium]
MLEYQNAHLRRLATAWVGAKSANEGVYLPRQLLVPPHDVVHEWLLGAFLKPFEKAAEFFYFHHEEDVSHHPVYQVCYTLFQNLEAFPEATKQLAQRLYEHSADSRMRGGEFLVMYFEDLALNGESTSAIGLWKVQSPQPFLYIERFPEQYALSIRSGISPEKPETAALIFNLDELDGYRICAIDTVSKRDEHSFWKDSFLGLRPVEDHYFQTRHHIALASEFIQQKLSHRFGLDRADQLDALYRSSLYFKENEHFDAEHFARTLFPQEAQQEAFKEHRETYARAHAIPLEDHFDISKAAVRKEFKVLKSVIKLDKNFHIYIHGRRDLIERGYDEVRGKKYYKVYFDEEE